MPEIHAAIHESHANIDASTLVEKVRHDGKKVKPPQGHHLSDCAGGRDISHAEVALDILEAAARIKSQGRVAPDKIFVIGRSRCGRDIGLLRRSKTIGLLRSTPCSAR
jgi:hypothetical protein